METAYVMINCDLGFEDNVIEDLKHVTLVDEVQSTFGAFDIIAKLKNPDRDKVRDAITWNIRKMEHVRSTLTLMGIPDQSWKKN